MSSWAAAIGSVVHQVGRPRADPPHDADRLSPFDVCSPTGLAGLTCCTGDKTQLSKRATHRHQCKCQRSDKRNVFLVRRLRFRQACGFSRSCQQLPSGAGARTRLAERGIVLRRCRISLLYQARELGAQDFELICLTWVELWGFEPQTSCMPSAGSTSTAVHTCRSASQDVRTSPPRSRQVAVLFCCTLWVYRLAGIHSRCITVGHLHSYPSTCRF
jgi:hypothetical protein